MKRLLLSGLLGLAIAASVAPGCSSGEPPVRVPRSTPLTDQAEGGSSTQPAATTPGPVPVAQEARGYSSGELPATLPVSTPMAEEAKEATYWLNTATGVRHNRNCRYFGKTKQGRPCKANEGRACKLCGG
jgi:hypothetical protein